LATATRRGDTLTLVFDVDHRDSGLPYKMIDRYSDSCTVLVSDPVIECWMRNGPGQTLGAKVFGTFPQLTYQMRDFGHSNFTLPGDIVLDFRPEPRLAGE
jgi:hypothetical protein